MRTLPLEESCYLEEVVEEVAMEVTEEAMLVRELMRQGMEAGPTSSDLAFLDLKTSSS